MAAVRPPIDHGTILITGASAGIGRALARQLGSRARALVLVARRAERLEELQTQLQAAHPGLRVYPLPCDLADPAALEAMLSDARSAAGDVDVLVNNAGVGDFALYDRADWTRIHRILQLNVVALALLTHRLVGPMVERGRGGILNISSGAGVALLPGAAAYVGTKHFVTGFTETLRLELADTGVVITQSLPGPVETEFNEIAGAPGGMTGALEVLRISAEQCARETIQGFERGRAMVFPGFGYRALMRFQGLAPRSLQRLAARETARRLRRARRQFPTKG